MAEAQESSEQISQKLLAEYYSILNPPAASNQKALATSSVSRCRTPFISKVQSYWPQLTVQARLTLQPVFLRPTETFSSDWPYVYGGNILIETYETDNFVIWYTLDEDSLHACDPTDIYDPLQPEGSHADDVPDYVNHVGESAEEVFLKICNDYGYKIPLNDGEGGLDERYDIYIADVYPTLAFGYATPSQFELDDLGEDVQAKMDSTTINDIPSYLVLDNGYMEIDLAVSEFNNRLEPMQITMAHEFYHMVQFSYNFLEAEVRDEEGVMLDFNPWWMEASAVWMENEVYDDIDDYIYNYLDPEIDNVLTKPGNRLDYYFNIKDFHYSTGLWPMSISQDVDKRMIRDIWEKGSRPVVRDDDLDSTLLVLGSLAGMAEAAEERGGDFVGLFGAYQAKRYFTGDRLTDAVTFNLAFEEAELYTEVEVPLISINTSMHAFTPDPDSGERPEMLGGVYLTHAYNGDANLKVTFNGSEATGLNWGLNVILTGQDSTMVYKRGALSASTGKDELLVENFGQVYNRVVLNPYTVPKSLVNPVADEPVDTLDFGTDEYNYSVTLEYVNDSLPPLPSSIVSVESDGDSAVTVVWENFDTIDFAGVVLVRNSDHVPQSSTDGVVIYTGTGESFVDTNVDQGSYYYAVFVFDEMPNFTNSEYDSTYMAITFIDSTAPPALDAEELMVTDGQRDGRLNIDIASYSTPLDVAGYYIFVKSEDFDNIEELLPYDTTFLLEENHFITGLANNENYYTAIVPFDEAGNYITDVVTKRAMPTLRYLVTFILSEMGTDSRVNLYLDGNDSYKGIYLGEYTTRENSSLDMSLFPGDHHLEIRSLDYMTQSIDFSVRADGTILDTLAVTQKQSQTFSSSRTDSIDLEMDQESLWQVTTASFDSSSGRDLLVGTVSGKVLLFSDIDFDDSSSSVSFSLEAYDSSGTISTLDVGDNAAPVVVDWDDDGRDDILVGNGAGRVRYYKRFGDRNRLLFEDKGNLILHGDFDEELNVAKDASPVVVDIDYDGYKDLVVSGGLGLVYRFMNDINDPGEPYLDSQITVYDYESGQDVRFLNLSQSVGFSFKDISYDQLLEDLIIFDDKGDLHILRANDIDGISMYSKTDSRVVPLGLSGRPGCVVFDENDDGFRDAVVYQSQTNRILLYRGCFRETRPPPEVHHTKPVNCFVSSASFGRKTSPKLWAYLRKYLW